MRRTALLGAAGMLVLGGCGGTTAKPPAPPKPPHLPRALAQAWAQQADGVATALAAGDGCTAQRLAGTLRSEVVQAIGERRVARVFEQKLVGAVNALPGRITCNPPPPPDSAGFGFGFGKGHGPHGPHGHHGHRGGGD